MKHLIQLILLVSLGGILISCVNRMDITVNLSPMPDVNIKRYEGTWNEIARIPNKYEKGLDRVTATYYLRCDRRIAIRNAGYNQAGELKFVCGQGYVPNWKNPGHLRVSFVLPYRWFYGDYNILYVNKAYDLALVAGGDANHLWILSKRHHITEVEKQDLLGMARARGFDTQRLVWPKVF
ncbi:MAG: lipocalin family protein [Akkermansia sp.]